MWIDQQIETYRSRRAALDWFDAQCWIGVGPEGLLQPVESVDATRRLLARYGIHRAVVAHAAARDGDRPLGNRLLLEAIQNHSGLFGAAVLAPGDVPTETPRGPRAEPGADMPSQPIEASARGWPAYLASLAAAKVRMIRAFPRAHRFKLSDRSAEPWLEAIADAGLPLAVWHVETTWDDLAAVCERYPRLNVIVEGPNRKLIYHNRIYYGLLERFANFHLAIDNLVNYLGVDDIVRRFGSQRLIFGSYLPHQDPNAAMGMVIEGDMTPSDRENIAFRNLERLAEVAR
jgi:hypothetical protein